MLLVISHVFPSIDTHQIFGNCPCLTITSPILHPRKHQFFISIKYSQEFSSCGESNKVDFWRGFQMAPLRRTSDSSPTGDTCEEVCRKIRNVFATTVVSSICKTQVVTKAGVFPKMLSRHKNDFDVPIFFCISTYQYSSLCI